MTMKSNRKTYSNVNGNASSKDLVRKRDNPTKETFLFLFLFNLIIYSDDTSTYTSNPRPCMALQGLATTTLQLSRSILVHLPSTERRFQTCFIFNVLSSKIYFCDAKFRQIVIFWTGFDEYVAQSTPAILPSQFKSKQGATAGARQAWMVGRRLRALTL